MAARHTIAALIVTSLALGWPDAVPANQPTRRLERVATDGETGGRTGDRWAVVVGVDRYADDKIPLLSGAVADAGAKRDVLIEAAEFPRRTSGAARRIGAPLIGGAATVTTDDDGFFKIEGVAADAHVAITVEKAGYSTESEYPLPPKPVRSSTSSWRDSFGRPGRAQERRRRRPPRPR